MPGTRLTRVKNQGFDDETREKNSLFSFFLELKVKRSEVKGRACTFSSEAEPLALLVADDLSLVVADLDVPGYGALRELVRLGLPSSEGRVSSLRKLKRVRLLRVACACACGCVWWKSKNIFIICFFFSHIVSGE